MFLTIFTPVYNRGKYVSRLFDSIDAQTVKNFEWIIINDGSTDNTDEEIRKNKDNKDNKNILQWLQKVIKDVS